MDKVDSLNEEVYYEEPKKNGEVSNKMIIGIILFAVVLGGILFACQSLTKKVPYQPGKIIDEENVYVNDFFKIRFKCPDGYTMTRLVTTDAEMRDIYGDEFKGSVDNVIQELMVKADGSLSSMNIIVGNEAVDITKSSGLRKLEEIMQSRLSSVGDVSVDLGEPYVENVAGREYNAVDFNIDAEGYPMRMTIFTRIEKGYTIMITMAEINESINDLFEGFVEYK